MPKLKSECYQYVVHGTLKSALLSAPNSLFYIHNNNKSGWYVLSMCVWMGKLNMSFIIKLTCRNIVFLMMASQG